MLNGTHVDFRIFGFDGGLFLRISLAGLVLILGAVVCLADIVPNLFELQDVERTFFLQEAHLNINFKSLLTVDLRILLKFVVVVDLLQVTFKSLVNNSGGVSGGLDGLLSCLFLVLNSSESRLILLSESPFAVEVKQFVDGSLPLDHLGFFEDSWSVSKLFGHDTFARNVFDTLAIGVFLFQKTLLSCLQDFQAFLA